MHYFKHLHLLTDVSMLQYPMAYFWSMFLAFTNKAFGIQFLWPYHFWAKAYNKFFLMYLTSQIYFFYYVLEENININILIKKLKLLGF